MISVGVSLDGLPYTSAITAASRIDRNGYEIIRNVLEAASSESKEAAMWKMCATTYHEWMGEAIIGQRILEAESLIELVLLAQAFMEGRSGLFLYIPHYSNPRLSHSQYAEPIGGDIELGRDRTIKGYFATWLRNDRIIVRPLYTYKRSLSYGESL